MDPTTKVVYTMQAVIMQDMHAMITEAEAYKADEASAAERWKHGELAKYQGLMDAQVKLDEGKVAQAQREAAVAWKEERNDASESASMRLRAAQEHERRAVQALANAELSEKQRAHVLAEEAQSEHKELQVLEADVARDRAHRKERRELSAARRRERARMLQRFEVQQRLQARKDAKLKEEVEDARAEAERAESAAQKQAQQLAMARLQQRDMKVVSEEQRRLQAAENLAHQRKIEARKAKERADKIAAQLRLWHRSLPRGPRREGQEGGEQDHTLHMRGRLGGMEKGEGKTKAMIQAQVQHALAAYRQRTQAKMEQAIKQAASARTAKMAAALEHVEQRLRHEEDHNQLRVENVWGSLGAFSPPAMPQAQHMDTLHARPARIAPVAAVPMSAAGAQTATAEHRESAERGAAQRMEPEPGGAGGEDSEAVGAGRRREQSVRVLAKVPVRGGAQEGPEEAALEGRQATVVSLEKSEQQWKAEDAEATALGFSR